MSTLLQDQTTDNRLDHAIDAPDYAERVQWSIEQLESLASRFNSLAMDLRAALAGQHEPTPIEALAESEPREGDDDDWPEWIVNELEPDDLPWWASAPYDPELDAATYVPVEPDHYVTVVDRSGRVLRSTAPNVFDAVLAELHRRGVVSIGRADVTDVLGDWSQRVYGFVSPLDDQSVDHLATLAYELIQRRASRA